MPEETIKDAALTGFWREYQAMTGGRPIRQCDLEANYAEPERLSELPAQAVRPASRLRSVVRVISFLVMLVGGLACACGVALFFLTAFLAEPSAYKLGIAGILIAFGGLALTGCAWTALNYDA